MASTSSALMYGISPYNAIISQLSCKTFQERLMGAARIAFYMQGADTGA
jgi:hypothetical protein